MALFNQSYVNIASQFGMPLYGVAGVPPFPGNYFWVDETNGSDGNTGGPQDPFKTLAQAQTVVANGNNDVVFLNGTGTGVHSTATVAWAKNDVHLIGLCSPVKRGKRARLAASGTTAFTPLLNVTGTGCSFKDLQFFTGFATDASGSICVDVAGTHSTFDNCEFLGFGGAGTAAATASRAVYLTADENTFRGCVFGADTLARSVANYTLEFAGDVARNYFIECDFEMWATTVQTQSHLYAAAGAAIDRTTVFERCAFMNSIKSGSALAINQVANLAAAQGGLMLMQDCVSVGATHWETTPSNFMYFNNATITQTNPGVTENQTT